MGIIEQVKQMKFEEAKKEARKEGRREGRKEAEERKDRAFVESLLSNTSFSAIKIANLAGVSVEFVNNVKGSLKK